MSNVNPAIAALEISGVRDLVRRAQGGDAEAFGELCQAHEARLIRHAMTLCGDEAAAEDLAEETLVEAWRCLQRYNGRCRFLTWLCAILLNRHRNWRRRKRTSSLFNLFRRDAGLSSDPLADVPAREATPDETLAAQDEARLIQTCIAALPPKQQQVIHLRFYADEPLEGIAAVLGCSVGTVKSRLSYALDRLRGMRALNGRNGNPKDAPDLGPGEQSRPFYNLAPHEDVI